MGGKSNDNASREMINMQKQEAAEARAKEDARKARIAGGLEKIKAAFHGGNTYGTKQVAGAPTTSRVQGPSTTQRVWIGSGNGGGHWETKTVPGAWRTVTTPGATTSQQVVTGTAKDPTADFLKQYETDYLGNFLPQVATQFKDARDDTTYQLADAGTLQSSMAGDELAKLIEQNKINEADVRNKATSAVGDLKGRLAKEEAAAEAQLYSTEDPETAAANALHAVTNITAEDAPNTMLGDIFKVAAIGGANYLKGGANKAYRDQYVPGAQPASRIIPA
jgi:hypothetical protein